MQAIRKSRKYETVKAFAQKQVSHYLRSELNRVIESIKNEKDDYLLGVNEEEYINYKISDAHVEKLEIYSDQIELTESKESILGDAFPFEYDVKRGIYYDVNVLNFHIPYSGDPVLFECKPNIYIPTSFDIFLSDEEFYFQVLNISDDHERIRREKEDRLGVLLDQTANVNKDVKAYNATLDAEIRMAIEVRKQNILANSELVKSLGIPVKKEANVPSTFAVPSPKVKKKISIKKPEVTGSKPEPTLDESIYNAILELIHNAGKQFERQPSTYADKEEEHLRDNILVVLEPNFEGSATGETFNKKGKTDILLRHEGSNVFIAECKFWKGKVSFLKTITQLLSYLTWRDSKAAVIMFVQNKNFTSVLETAISAISEHSNYVDFKNSTEETWHNYKFHLNDDPNRHLNLAVMLYHIPEQK